MDASVKIRVGDIFTSSDADTGIARFLIVSRQAAVLWELMHDTPVTGEQHRERRTVLFVYYFAALKELVDAFHYLDTIGLVAALCDSKNSISELRDAAIHARQHLDKNNPDSLYSILLKRVRDSAGFHVSLPEVKRVMEELSDEQFPAAIVTGKEQTVLGLPIVSASLALIAAKTPINILESSNAARKLHLALEAVAHDLYFINVRIATEPHSQS